MFDLLKVQPVLFNCLAGNGRSHRVPISIDHQRLLVLLHRHEGSRWLLQWCEGFRLQFRCRRNSYLDAFVEGWFRLDTVFLERLCRGTQLYLLLLSPKINVRKKNVMSENHLKVAEEHAKECIERKLFGERVKLSCGTSLKT